ncbi:DsbA family protein [Patescibacteria group bacterium]|nr:DsbA family protein [Patescibacteria group bacterium]
MNADLKSNIAIVLSIVAIVLSTYGGGFGGSTQAEGPEGFLKQTAKDAGISGRTYDKCIEDPATTDLIEEDVREIETLAAAAGIPGLGTPFNIVMTDQQAFPVSGAYPYEFFDLVVKEITANGTISDELFEQLGTTPFDPVVIAKVRGLDTMTDHYRGSDDPQITIIEYSDLQCPFCSQVHPTLSRIVDENPNVAWVYRHLPLSSIHPQAMPAAVASECVATNEGNDAFWEFADTVFENQDQLQ